MSANRTAPRSGHGAVNRTAHPSGGGAPRPRVTVVIPCYNYARFLGDCVRSALSQDGVEVDALVLDDASTDGSAEVALRLQRADARVRVVVHESNHGHIATFNEGLARATGDYLVLVSSDDLLAPGALKRATAVMEARPEVGLVYGYPRVFQGSGVPRAHRSLPGARVWKGADWIRAQCNRGSSCIYSPEACVRASVQRAVGGYDPELPHTGDLQMWLRIASVARIGRVMGEQAFKRVHGGGMIETSFPHPITDLRLRHKAYESFFAGAGRASVNADRDRRLARARLAAEALDHACLALRAGALGGATDVGEYAELARQLAGREVVRLRQWREYRLLSAGKPEAGLRRGLLSYWALRREVAKRHKWYRWRLTGV